jgi:HK97 gp10 family phage protein
MRPSIKIVGAQDLERKLHKLGAITRQKVIEVALRAGAEVIAQEARNLVPERTGNLRDSIGVADESLNYSRGRLSKGQMEVFVGPEQGRNAPHDGFYGHMVEFGPIHSAPRPFMRPAFDTKSSEAADVVIERLRAEFNNATKG